MVQPKEFFTYFPIVTLSVATLVKCAILTEILIRFHEFHQKNSLIVASSFHFL